MMPFCSWKRCREVGTYKIDVAIQFQHPYLCNKHFKKLLHKLGISNADAINRTV